MIDSTLTDKLILHYSPALTAVTGFHNLDFRPYTGFTVGSQEAILITEFSNSYTFFKSEKKKRKERGQILSFAQLGTNLGLKVVGPRLL